MNRRQVLRIGLDFLMMTVGACIAAFAIEEFLVPCTILDGGVIGIGIMINNLTDVPFWLLTLLLNLPFLLFGATRLGKGFIIKSAYSMAAFSLFAALFEPLVNVTEDALLAVCFGGLLLGIGVGLVIRFGGCLDGTETVAILLNRRHKLPVGKVVLAFNVIIYAVAGVLFGLDRAMYSLLTYFITSRILDAVESGFEQTKAAMIITNDAEEIAALIFSRLGRTVTLMEGEGLVSGKKVVLYCVLTRFEVRELKAIIDEVDESAFVAVSDVSEIIGNHVKRKGKLKETESED